MKTRKILLLVLILAATNVQAQVWTWPIAGQKAGANILSRPNTHIDKELNVSDLFIGGKEGDAVVCPADGIIEDISINSRISNKPYNLLLMANTSVLQTHLQSPMLPNITTICGYGLPPLSEPLPYSRY